MSQAPSGPVKPASSPDLNNTTVDPEVGLTAVEVADRISRGLTNDTPDPKSRSYGSIIRANTLTSFNLVIGTMWVLMIIARSPFQDSLFGVVIVVNAAIGTFQEIRAKLTLERLSVLGEARPVVRRGGSDQEVSPKEVVLDDIILLRTGDQIVVDGVVRATVGMEVDESLLTGEADPVHKHPGDPLMSGSFVVAGDGTMQATKIGEASYATQLTAAARTFTVAQSELMNSIMRFVRTITWVLIPLGTLLFVSQMRASPDWQQALSGTVAGVVTMVPEGLVLLTSVAMAVAVVRLGRRRTLVQQMPAVEVLARVDVVCVDKTGTLTEPGMAFGRLVKLAPDGTARQAPEGGSDGDSDGDSNEVAEALGALGVSEANPNPTLAAVAAEFADPGWDLVRAVPFSSARKWSAGVFASHGAWVLGAAEILLPDGDSAVARQVAMTAAPVAATGARVLLLARGAGEGQPDADTGPGELVPMALVSIAQHLRPDAAETVAYFRRQGVVLKVISGDNPATVAAIATQAGIPDEAGAFDARNLPTDLGELETVVEEHNVFGRVNPDQKRAMVGALQRRGHTVAMTGDGVNDVLALKDADLGIAMGSGASATRAVAQLVLLDSQFSALPHVVAEGRRVLGNIERVSDLFLTKSFYASLLSLMTVVFTLTQVFEVEFVFLPRHLTLITFLTIGTPAFFMALMPNTQRFRPGFFRRVLRFAVPAGVVCSISAFSSYALVLVGGHPLNTARTAAAVTLFIVAWTVLLLVAQPLNRWRLAIVVVMGLGFPFVLAIPVLSNFFALYVTASSEFVWSVGIGVVGAIVLSTIRRAIERRYAHPNP